MDVSEKFKNYLYGSSCIVYSDNNPLSHLNTSKQAPVTDQRCTAQLADYNLDNYYKHGKNNQNADILSRHPNLKKKGVITHALLTKMLEIYSRPATFLHPSTLGRKCHIVHCNSKTAQQPQPQSTTLPGLQKADLRKLQRDERTSQTS